MASADPSRLAQEVADLYLADKLQATTAPLPATGAGAASNLGPFAGKYLDRRVHSAISFTVVGGNLLVKGESLKRVASKRFEAPGGSIVTFDSSDGTMKATVSREGEISFEGTRIDLLHLTDAALASYAGAYRSAELDATYKLSIEKGSLMLQRNWSPPLKLNPLVRDEFDSDELGTLVFHRDAEDRVSGLSVFAGRIRNVSFEKSN